MIFAVLDLRVAEVVLKRRFKLLSFFTIIFAVFLHDFALYDALVKKFAALFKIRLILPSTS